MEKTNQKGPDPTADRRAWTQHSRTDLSDTAETWKYEHRNGMKNSAVIIGPVCGLLAESPFPRLAVLLLPVLEMPSTGEEERRRL